MRKKWSDTSKCTGTAAVTYIYLLYTVVALVLYICTLPREPDPSWHHYVIFASQSRTKIVLYFYNTTTPSAVIAPSLYIYRYRDPPLICCTRCLPREPLSLLLPIIVAMTFSCKTKGEHRLKPLFASTLNVIILFISDRTRNALDINLHARHHSYITSHCRILIINFIFNIKLLL